MAPGRDEKKSAPKPLNELLSRTMVDIYVGPSNNHWILHEKLLCYHSPFFRRIFQSSSSNSADSPSATKSYGLPEDDDAAFTAFVGWLYSASVRPARAEADLSTLLDLYLLANKFEIASLQRDVLGEVRQWYHVSDTYPGLRRVQYVYANTEDGDALRGLLVRCVARMLTLSSAGGTPKHWDKALRKNGQLAVDIIAVVQGWGWRGEEVPDARNDDEGASEGYGSQETESKKEGGDGVRVDVKKEPEEKGWPSGGAGGKTGNANGKLLKELPNGLHNGLPNGVNGYD